MPDQEYGNIGAVQAVLEGFSGVWERVTGMPDAGKPLKKPLAADPTSRGDALRELSERAAEAAMFDRALACRCGGAGRSMLQEQAAQAFHRAAYLRGEVFIRTGERLRRPESCPRLGETLTALRESMLRDEASCRAYRRLAEQTDDGELRGVLERFACETAAAAAEKHRSILRCFA